MVAPLLPSVPLPFHTFPSGLYVFARKSHVTNKGKKPDPLPVVITQRHKAKLQAFHFWVGRGAVSPHAGRWTSHFCPSLW